MEQWQHELQRCIRSVEQLETVLPIGNRESIRNVLSKMRLSITPHTASLIRFDDPDDPLLLMSVPTERELVVSPEELADPIGDESKSPVPFLTHRYRDRVLIYVTFSCSHYCRFCFRRSKTGQASPGPSAADAERMIEYLRSHPEVDEVILTGGDPLTLLDDQLEEWLQRLRGVETVRRIRIHTRVLVNLPSRITGSLVSTLRRHQGPRRPVYVVTHFNHPREIADANVDAIGKLVDAGIVVRNQGVLLRRVNDDPNTLSDLFRSLVDARVVPYYFHQLDLARGTNHFRVPIEEGIGLMRALQGKLTGIAIPRYMLDLPGGNGKIPLSYPYLTKVEGSYLSESPDGTRIPYREPS